MSTACCDLTHSNVIALAQDRDVSSIENCRPTKHFVHFPQPPTFLVIRTKVPYFAQTDPWRCLSYLFFFFWHGSTRWRGHFVEGGVAVGVVAAFLFIFEVLGVGLSRVVLQLAVAGRGVRRRQYRRLSRRVRLRVSSTV